MLTNKISKFKVNEFADWARLDPLYFSGLTLSGCGIQRNSICSEYWEQFDGGSTVLTRESLAHAIATAENKVSYFLGTHTHPTWTLDEEIEVPTIYDKKFYPASGINLEKMIFTTEFSFVKQFGQPEKILIDTVNVTRQTLSGSAFKETAFLDVTVPADVSIYDIKLFVPLQNANEVYEITPYKIVNFDTNTRILTIQIDSWLLLKPELYITRNYGGNDKALDACDDNNYLDELEVWYEIASTCLPQAEILYEDKVDCSPNCELLSIPACVQIIDKCAGTFSIKLQDYDDENCVVDKRPQLNCFIPRIIKINYQSGCYTNTNEACELLKGPVFKLAIAELPYTRCDCACFMGIIEKYQSDTSYKEGSLVNFPNRIRERAIWGTTLGALEAQMELEQYYENICNRS